MENERSHPLLAQVPLTVSPFVSLPTATTLPYTYKTLPSGLPASSIVTNAQSSAEATGLQQQYNTESATPKFVVSASGHAAHPDDIIASCQALQAHLEKLMADANRTLQEWNSQINDRELAEKRRVAPGYLDRTERILEPSRALDTNQDSTMASLLDSRPAEAEEQDSSLRTNPSLSSDKAGEELDRAFGTLKM